MNSFPTLTMSERDRRWKKTDEFLSVQGLDALLIFGMKGREPFEAYLANENTDGAVLYPGDGQPVQFTWADHRVTRRAGAGAAGRESWIADIRVGPYSQTINAAIDDQKLGKARIGVVGLDSKTAGEPEGIIPYRTWTRILDHAPNASFVDVSRDFALLMVPKSEEELAIIRHGAAIGEAACQALLDVAAPGVNEAELYATVQYEMHRRGAGSVDPKLNLFTGPAELGWGPPLWAQASWAPRDLEQGDIIQTEIFPVYGAFETQQQMCIGLASIAAEYERLAAVAEESYRAAVTTMRPGVSFGAVCDAMAAPHKREGLWHSVLIHTLAPLVMVSGRYKGTEFSDERPSPTGPRSEDVGADVLLEPGMVFALEPDACLGMKRINIGGTVVVSADGVEELNTLPNKMNLKTV